jgi:hypothetical protein
MKRGGKEKGNNTSNGVELNGKHKGGQPAEEKAPSVFYTIRLVLALILWTPLTGIPGIFAICENSLRSCPSYEVCGRPHYTTALIDALLIDLGSRNHYIWLRGSKSKISPIPKRKLICKQMISQCSRHFLGCQPANALLGNALFVSSR